jgi:hypothetical protein
MQSENLLVKKQSEYSQNGEDGIIEELFSRIGVTSKACCEFGAWDGVHFSNCRKLVLEGWRAVMIEGDSTKFVRLRSTYKDTPGVSCMNRFVDTDTNRLDILLRECDVPNLDFLSIDIDGLDFEIFESLAARPRVICVEVNAGHDPTRKTQIPRAIAQGNVGQSLLWFVEVADQKGYGLVCYTGNAFFVQRHLIEQFGLPLLSSQEAYELFLKHLTAPEREWLYLVNLGVVVPHYNFSNPYLSRSGLGMSLGRAIVLRSTATAIIPLRKIARRAKNLLA